ncbi:MAG: hypothetical protein ABI833_07750 [Acidobacteriota bacterium]
MNQKSSIAMLMAVLLAGQSTAMAAPAPVELKWSELSFHIQGRNIELVLPEGTSVGARWKQSARMPLFSRFVKPRMQKPIPRETQ